MKLLSGTKRAEEILDDVAKESKQFHDRGITPTLAVVLVGDNSASKLYVSKKKKIAKSVGIDFLLYDLPEGISEEDLAQLLTTLHLDDTVHGIVIQLPLPKNINLDDVCKFLDPDKDIDSFGKNAKFLPPTASAVMELLKHYRIDVKNKKVAIVGEGFLVGKPLKKLLEKNGARIISFSKASKDIAEETRSADILISATGQPKLINKTYTNKDQIVIDVGSARDPKTNKVVGDVDRKSVEPNIAAITPRIGGVGPITIAFLMQNVIFAAKHNQ